MQPKITDRIRIILYPGLAAGPDSIVGLVDLEDRLVVVDAGTGMPGSLAVLARGISEAGWPTKPVTHVVNTHGHAPNAGGDWWFHDALRAVVAARDPDASWIEHGDPEKTGAVDLGIGFRPVVVGLRPTQEEQVLYDDVVGIILLHTPGHTPGSQTIIIEEPGARTLFIGDALGRLSRRWDSSEEDWWRSLEKIRGRDPDYLCTSVTCMDRGAAARFLEEVERVGPEWIDE